MWRWIRTYIFHEFAAPQAMTGALLPLAFAIPGYLVWALWPGPGESPLWKVLALLLAPMVFTAMWAVYGYFVLRLGERESEARRRARQ